MTNYYSGVKHIFSGRTPDSEPYIYLKAGQGESLVVEGTFSGNSTTATYADTAGSATYATTSGSVSGSIAIAENAKGLYKGEEIDSVNIGVALTLSDPLPTGTPYKGCSVSVHNNDMFIGNPGDTRSSRRGTISYFKKVSGVWTYDSFFIPPFVLPSCTAHLQYWGYSISHRNNLMLVSSPDGPVSGTSIYKKTGATWANISSTTISGTHVHTDGNHGAAWFTMTNAEDVDICDNGTFVRTITTPTRDTRDAWVNNGQVAIACSSGHLYIYNISSGALVSTYSANSAFGYLVSMTTTYIASIANDKRSLLIIKRSDGSYYGSFKYDQDIKQIKLENGVLMVGFKDSAMFYYDNGSVFFETQATFDYFPRDDDTSPYPSSIWPKVIDFDTGTSTTVVSGVPLSGSGSGIVNYATMTIAPRLTYYSSIFLYNDQMYVIAKPKVNILDPAVNPLNYETCTLQAKGLGSEKLFTGSARITGTTPSTSVSTGSLINSGGLGNAGRITTTDLTCINSIAGKNIYCICHTSNNTPLTSTIAFNAIFTSPTIINNGMSADSYGGISVPETGTYLVSSSVIFASNSSGYRETFYEITNGSYLGSTYVGHNTMTPINGAAHRITSSLMMYLTANTRVSIIAYQNSGSTLNASGHLSITKITS